MQEKIYRFIMIISCDSVESYSSKMSPRTLKNVDYFESYLKFKKALKSIISISISAITSSKFNKTNSCWAHFIKNFYSFKFIQENKFFHLYRVSQ